MTRLQFAQEKGVEPLRRAGQSTVQACLDAIRDEAPLIWEKIRSLPLVISGNSAMVSFFLGWDISTLAVSPFQPERRESGTGKMADGREVISLPLLAGFVGGDTVAGIMTLRQRRVPAPWMLVDIGTNTEIVIDNGKGEYWLSSAPAGPAFEGGNIAQGMRAEGGAISRAYYENGWRLETIGGDVPKGICGSGLVDILHEGVKAGLIHKDGFVPEGRLDVAEDLGVLADDVREFQLAKSATRTAAELLIDRAGVKPARIYLAGAFAQHLRPESVEGVGLLPPGIPVETVGNASLAGAVLYASMRSDERENLWQDLEKRRQPVELALQDDFQERFVSNLNFK